MPASEWPVRLLGPAVEAGRKALRERDSDRVPDRLRRVNASSDRSLTPPLAKALLAELDSNDELREEALAELVGSTQADHVASLTFLERPEGWQLRLEELSEESTVSTLQHENAALRQRLEERDHQLAMAKQKARDATRAAERAAARSSQPVVATKGSTSPDAADLEKRLTEMHLEHEELSARLTETEQRLVRARAEVLRSRKANTEQTRSMTDLPLTDPLAMAKHLDTLAKALVTTSSEERLGAGADDQLAIPGGIRPDSHESVGWLLDRSGPVSVVVDGYNVTFKTDRRRFHEPEARDRLDHHLAELKRLASGTLRVIVVYDSGFGSGEEEARGPGGIERVFAAEGRTADDEILLLVPSLAAPVVVVSSDRAVREQAENLGSLGLWSEALAEWIARRRPLSK